MAMLSGYGMRIRLDQDADAGPGTIHLTHAQSWPQGRAKAGETLVSPDGARIIVTHDGSWLDAPPLVAPEIIVCRANASTWRTGRAGMQYRDLVPDRLGGRYIASHIRIPNGGPVPDYVHHHQVRFQMIFCRRGWVRVVYEDQGPPFVMEAGDCVLQPPHIRHRVLDSSDGMEVVEVSSPAEHMTLVDHELELPTPLLRPGRDFGGQRFVFWKSREQTWGPGPYAGFQSADTGIAIATDGLASARIVRSTGDTSATVVDPCAECWFSFVLKGDLALACGAEQSWSLSPNDAFVIPAGAGFSLKPVSSGIELLQVSLT